MLVWLFEYLKEFVHGFAVFQYLTIRAVFAALTSLSIALIIGPPIIRYLSRAQIGQVIREDGPRAHYGKAGTPTMGGVLILIAMLLSTILWSNLNNHYVWVVIFTTICFGTIGWIDDYIKLIKNHPRGLAAKWKYTLQSIFGLITVTILYNLASTPVETSLLIPFFKELIFPLGVFYIVLGYFVIVGSSNAVNLTDGLDGLAILPVVMVGGALGIFAYVTGHIWFAEYLSMFYIHGVEEIVIFCAALVGAGLGFLWFNAYPAQIFMGDVGSLGLGAALGVVAMILRQELVLFIMGGIFVIETLSVILQVASYKLTKRRVFKMAPIHHHFELKGWPEPKIIVRFWIITVMLVLVGLATLKIR